MPFFADTTTTNRSCEHLCKRRTTNLAALRYDSSSVKTDPPSFITTVRRNAQPSMLAVSLAEIFRQWGCERGASTPTIPFWEFGFSDRGRSHETLSLPYRSPQRTTVHARRLLSRNIQTVGMRTW